ncbi:hypothetical protein EG359_18005 [Chryseobacterium joostei]|uniref:Histidine kinase n=1 Tax=Chryseobacterium joostei TaxID=112234 RepID=A0A1N7K4G8_9FLAO|nr:hypothetical protein [Chryseobacterium joostei]AZB01392.1 hypothetical protein EG359_18005 [Chryseobacterium joostei]SIS56502.1 hypothetical protein SAMN05421768_11026 [Chryseobacterium joostei]
MIRLLALYRSHISASVTFILISFFFNLSITFYTTADNYSNESLIALKQKRLNYLDSLDFNLEKNNSLLQKMVSFKTKSDSLREASEKRGIIILKSLNSYLNNNYPKDSLKYFLNKVNEIKRDLPFEIGILKAYNDIDLRERKSQYTAQLNLLLSEYEIVKDLSLYYKKKLKRNNATDKKMESFIIDQTAYDNYIKDSLYIIKFDDSVQRKYKIEFKNYENSIDEYGWKAKLYTFLWIFCACITLILLIISFFLKFFKQ